MIPTEFIGFARSQHPIELEGEVREGGGGWVGCGVNGWVSGWVKGWVGE